MEKEETNNKITFVSSEKEANLLIENEKAGHSLHSLDRNSKKEFSR